MNKLSQHWKKIANGSLAAMAALSTSAYAVKDLPGGPAVNQLNLHAPATKLAADQAGLHVFMMVICMVISSSKSMERPSGDCAANSAAFRDGPTRCTPGITL